MPEFFVIAAILFLIWLFGVAGLQKLRSVSWYATLMARYLDRKAVPHVWVRLVACVELGCCALLLVPATSAAGLALACVLLLGYALLMFLQLRRGKADMNCGCAGPASDTSISSGLIYRNLACALVASLSLAPVSVMVSWNVPMVLITGLLSVFMMLIYSASEQVIANSQRIAGAF
jgi:Methylamine utilisation protein MauE